MQFGKTIQSQQVPGWGEYYLNYKASDSHAIVLYAAYTPSRLSRRSSTRTRLADRLPMLHSSLSASARPNALSTHPTILEPIVLPPPLQPTLPSPRRGSVKATRTRQDGD